MRSRASRSTPTRSGSCTAASEQLLAYLVANRRDCSRRRPKDSYRTSALPPGQRPSDLLIIAGVPPGPYPLGRNDRVATSAAAVSRRATALDSPPPTEASSRGSSARRPRRLLHRTPLRTPERRVRAIHDAALFYDIARFPSRFHVRPEDIDAGSSSASATRCAFPVGPVRMLRGLRWPRGLIFRSTLHEAALAATGRRLPKRAAADEDSPNPRRVRRESEGGRGGNVAGRTFATAARRDHHKLNNTRIYDAAKRLDPGSKKRDYCHRNPGRQTTSCVCRLLPERKQIAAIVTFVLSPRRWYDTITRKGRPTIAPGVRRLPTQKYTASPATNRSHRPAVHQYYNPQA